MATVMVTACALVPGVCPDPGPEIYDASVEAIVCTLASNMKDAEATLRKHEPGPARYLSPTTCDTATTEPRSSHGSDDGPPPAQRAPRVIVQTELGPVTGNLILVPGAARIVVVFSGLGVPAAGVVAREFAEEAASLGMSSFRIERSDLKRPFNLDPKIEAERAMAAIEVVIRTCAQDGSQVAFAGFSAGGMEALLAARASGAPVAVLDPLLDPMAVCQHLDRTVPESIGHAQNQRFFRRMLSERFEEPGIGLCEVLGRSFREGSTRNSDAPASWLCELAPDERRKFGIMLSKEDPALGTDNRAVLETCGFPVQLLDVEGHVPVSCAPHAVRDLLRPLTAER